MTIVAFLHAFGVHKSSVDRVLNAERGAIAMWAASAGAEIIATVTETARGKKIARPQFAAALALAKETGSRLVFARAGKLSRRLDFLTALQEHGAGFVALSTPGLNEQTLGSLVHVATERRAAVSRIICDAVARARSQGKRLGSPRGRRVHADRRATELEPAIVALVEEGITRPTRIAARLTALGVRAARGGPLYRHAVCRMLQRLCPACNATRRAADKPEAED
ncbi:MAG: resolvase [Betaproteobacteria bacterium]|nr:resolvase [Betaproteobacteria bacterium]